MNNKKVSEITIMDITEKMLNFTLRDEITEASKYAEYNAGTRDALNEMREDMQKMTEEEFTEKYEERSLEKGDESFELEEGDPKAQYIEGYCNTIEDVLSLLNPAYIYDQMTMLAEGFDSECGCGCDCDACGEDCHEHEHDHDCDCGHCH